MWPLPSSPLNLVNVLHSPNIEVKDVSSRPSIHLLVFNQSSSVIVVGNDGAGVKQLKKPVMLETAPQSIITYVTYGN